MLYRTLARLAILLTVLALAAPLTPASAAQSRPYADPAFQRLWERYDRPVEQLLTRRSWTWGPNSPYNGYEPFKQGRDGRRLVQYFDKTRMEINDPTLERDAPFYVSNGLLVREMVAGKVALGDKAEDVETREPAEEAVAGDPSTVNEDAPTYTSFKDVASLGADRPSDNRIGLKVFDTIDQRGRVRSLPRDRERLADLVKIAIHEPTLRHNIPDRFWDFLNQKGMVYENGRYLPDGTVFQPWVFAMGVPITEPYWVITKVGGLERDVLVQLFERRVLTYTPSNLPGFEVEMGNVGQHYYRWRYGISSEPSDTGGDRPRIIEGPTRTALAATTATIEWRTSRPTTSHLEYGLSDVDLTVRAGASEFVTQHKVTLTGLLPNKRYYWRIISRDRDGKIVEDTVHSFLTPPS